MTVRAPMVHDVGAASLDVRVLHDVVRLRVDVFVVEQACPYHELDGRDLEPSTRHLWIDDADGIAAYARLLTDDASTRIGRIVTAPRARGLGLATGLVEHAVAHSPGPWVLDAQAHLVDWYCGLGFAAVGPVFVEDGIPHQRMERHAG